MFIKDNIDSSALVTLFTRPRRFGKTLNLSMLRRFFEDERKADGAPVDNRYLFNGLAISQCGEEYLQHQQKYPVIALSLKSAKQPDFQQAYMKLKTEIGEEFRRHKYVMNGDVLDEDQIKRFSDIITGEGAYEDYNAAIQFLSVCLEKYHGTNGECILPWFL